MNYPLYHRIYDAATLLREHPPRLNHPHKKALFEIAYPQGSTPRGKVEVTRWPRLVAEPLALAASPTIDVRPDFYDYAPAATQTPAVEWHVNFADPSLFGFYGSGLFAQDEMQVAEHPLLASVREALQADGLPPSTTDSKGGTPVLVQNVERRIEVATNPDAAAGRPAGLYGNRFKAAPIDVVRQAVRTIDPPTVSNIIAIAAPPGGAGAYSAGEIASIFSTAYTAFAAARTESDRTRVDRGPGSAVQLVVHTGFWGCGAFGGNRVLMTALQCLAASAAGVDQIVFHAGDERGTSDARRGVETAEQLRSACGAKCSLDTLSARAEGLGLQWGSSDGN